MDMNNSTINGNHSGNYDNYSRNAARVMSHADIVSHHVTSYVLPAICCFGILGNILIIVVLTRYHWHRSVSTSETVIHAGLFTMAVSDLMFSISVIPLAFVDEGALLLPSGSFQLFYNLYGTGFITTFSLSSTWLIVVTAGLRYIGVCHPLRARYWITRHAIFVIIGVICCLCVLGNLPQFWIQKAVPYEDNGITKMLIDMGPFSHEYTRGVVYSWIRAFFATFIPGVLLVYFNTRLIVTLHASRRLHAEHVVQCSNPARSRREADSNNRLTRTLIAVIVMFILLVYPDSLFDFFTHLAPIIEIKNNETVLIARVVVNTMQVSNYAFNFILYCVINATFRRTLTEIMCSCCRRKRQKERTGPYQKRLLSPEEGCHSNLANSVVTLTTVF